MYIEYLEHPKVHVFIIDTILFYFCFEHLFLKKSTPSNSSVVFFSTQLFVQLLLIGELAITTHSALLETYTAITF